MVLAARSLKRVSLGLRLSVFSYVHLIIAITQCFRTRGRLPRIQHAACHAARVRGTAWPIVLYHGQGLHFGFPAVQRAATIFSFRRGRLDCGLRWVCWLGALPTRPRLAPYPLHQRPLYLSSRDEAKSHRDDFMFCTLLLDKFARQVHFECRSPSFWMTSLTRMGDH